MSSTATSTGITSQIWQRLVRQGDTNGDKSLSKDEFEALRAGFKNSADLDQIIRAYDTNGDGSLSSPELPSSPLDVEMLGPMLDWQEYGKADATTRAEDDKRVVDGLFKRADVNGDGFLSKEEMEAESNLRRTHWLEGKAKDDDPVWIIRRGADENHLSPEDFELGRYVPFDSIAKVVPPEEVPAEVREAHEKAMEEWKNSSNYKKPQTEEEFRQEMTTKVLNTPLNATYISRLLSQLSASIAKGDPANTLRSDTDGTVA